MVEFTVVDLDNINLILQTNRFSVHQGLNLHCDI